VSLEHHLYHRASTRLSLCYISERGSVTRATVNEPAC
jgi:hypothetical protein